MSRSDISRFAGALIGAFLLTLSGCSRQAPPQAPTPPAATPRGAAVAPADSTRPQGPGAEGGRAGPRPYARVITGEAETRVGLFKTHRIGEKLFFEIPREELGKEMLLLTRIAAGNGTGGGRVVRWEREGSRILLRQQSFEVVADSGAAIHRAVAAAALGPIIASFAIESWGPDSAAVIETTRLYTTDIPELAGVNRVVQDRSFIESVAAFPDNIEVRATQTGTAATGPDAPARNRPETVSARLHWSMLRLPAEPMMPRLHDKRVGYGSVTQTDYGRPEHRAATRRYIRRFRLEKRDPDAEISEPVRPIVFWIDPATPEWLVPWVEKGVEAWKPAFEEAGFRDAILARRAPTPEEDPDWSLYDARHSVIYWRPSTVRNATGGQQVDPRTGEILKAEVNMYHNVMDLLGRWYFVQVAPLDPRARSLPLPDSLMGRLVEYVVSHEVGHAIGLPHNMKASSTYPPDSVRSAAFLRRMGGHVATLMDYSRFNYVAQPEDGIPVDLLVPRVGPYDRFAVRWGHRPIPGARTPDDERETLDRWARMQDTIPWLRYETSDAPNDPGAITEAVGDADAVRSSALALRNLERVMALLLPAAERPGEDYSLLDELYGEAVSQWGRYMGHVVALVGGAESRERYGTGTRFTPVPRARQREAVRFLNRSAFRTPPYFTNPEILRRIEAEGVIGRIHAAQARLLDALLGAPRLNRLIEYEALATRPDSAYTVADLLGDLRRGVWGELSAPTVRIDVYRRNLQRAYLAAVHRHLVEAPARVEVRASGERPPPRPFPSDARPILRGELLELDRAVQAALRRTGDAMTRLHLRDVRLEIERMLDPKR